MTARPGQLVKLESGAWAVLREVPVPGLVGRKMLIAMAVDGALQERLDDPTSTETELPADAFVAAPSQLQP